MSIDYAFKSYVLNNCEELVKKQKECSLLDYSLYHLEETGEINSVLKLRGKYDMTDRDLFYWCLENGLLKEYQEAKKINHASFERTTRLKKRVTDLLLGGPCIFVTMTFTDDVLYATERPQRRTAVTRFLKACKGPYVANIDFGKENHREHYHALIQCESLNLEPWRKHWGNINVERVRLSKNANVRLAKYVCKLTNHAIKETTKRSALIYSR